MLCPQCQQGVQTRELDEGRCPYCRFPCAELHRRVNHVQMILGAIFISTLVYGVVVVMLELWRGYEAPGLGEAETVIGMALIGASAGLLMASILFERRVGDDASLDNYSQMLVILGAIAEVPAVFGLLMYLLAGSIQWMVIFLVLCWAMLIRLGLRLPKILHGMTDCLRTD